MQLRLVAEFAQLGVQHAGYAIASPRDLMAVAAVALAGLVLAFLAQQAGAASAISAGPLTGRAVALSEKSRGARFQRQRDPDAAGRARPRAPSAVPAAA
ncbi:MAG: DUF6412 domain-containing protein [Streptosporangiaceae bacterium]|jgi:hypothetical protein|nr:hypothetical protein [Actinomycetota bacterium]